LLIINAQPGSIAAARTQLRIDPSVENMLFTPAAPGGIDRAVSQEDLDDMLASLDVIEAEGGDPQDTVVLRRDDHDLLLSGALINALSGVKPNEHLGPFIGHGDIGIWFDVYQPAQRIEVWEQGNPAPAIVFTEARRKLIHTKKSKVDIEQGTVWIRGDLIDSSLPPYAYVGIKVEDGSLKLNQPITVDDDVIKVSSALVGILELKLTADKVTPSPGGCEAARADVVLPESLTFEFSAGSLTVTGVKGQADVWGQTFRFGTSTGAWRFIERLWTVILECEGEPQEFDTEPIGDDLVQFAGVGQVDVAGLAFPVVLAPNISILGEAAIDPGWALMINNLMARWYTPDERFHPLKNLWLHINAYGANIAVEPIKPLTPAVSHVYQLWTIRGGSEHRLPWRQTYSTPFSLIYRCHVIEGEQFMVFGDADIDLDRPVTTNGQPVPTPSKLGVELLTQVNGEITTTLAAAIDAGNRQHQFALRNALVWTNAPVMLIVRGKPGNSVPDPQLVESGQAQLLFGVYGWAPILPDPYVSNAFINFNRKFTGQASGLLWSRITWDTPNNVTVTFEGSLGNNVHIGGRSPSEAGSRAFPSGRNNPDVGLTQTEQGQLLSDGESDLAVAQARFSGDDTTRPNETFQERLRRAERSNNESLGLINGYLQEFLGPTPQVLLLDVSTNQDLLGIAIGPQRGHSRVAGTHVQASDTAANNAGFPVFNLEVHSQASSMRVVALPQVQWEPVRTLDIDQDIIKLGWFPTPLASSNDGGATHIGTRSQTLRPITPESALEGTYSAFKSGEMVGIRTTFPFGLIGVIALQPTQVGARQADLYELTRPEFPNEDAVGGIQITVKAEGGREADDGISPMFRGAMQQLLNGVDLSSGVALGISVLGSTADPDSNVEAIFNNDMAANPRVPVTRVELSGYGGTSFSEWNDPFAAFAAAAKVQFRYMVGRTALEIIKVTSPLHPFGARLTRSVTIERRPGGGVIRRDSGWQALTPGLFDYRYQDKDTGMITNADYIFDAGVFQGLFNIRNIRPAPGTAFKRGEDTLVPYYVDADVALENVSGRSTAYGILGYLQTTPNGKPVSRDTLKALIEQQGPIGGPLNTWMNFGGSGLPFHVQRVEVGLAIDGPNPIFVATVRGMPALPTTGSWSVVTRPVSAIPTDGDEAVPVAEKRGVPIIRRYAVSYPLNKQTFLQPPLSGPKGNYRFADAADLMKPGNPENEYALMQTTATHAFLFPRPYVAAAGGSQLRTDTKPALADILARSTSKGAFPPSQNTIELAAGSRQMNVSPSGKLALSSPIVVNAHPKPLRIAGETGHGTAAVYDKSTLRLNIQDEFWEAEFAGIEVWADIVGIERLTGTRIRIVGSTNQRSQIAEIESLLLQEIEEILQYLPGFNQRGIHGPTDLDASNAKREVKFKMGLKLTYPTPEQELYDPKPAGTGIKFMILVEHSIFTDKVSAGFTASLEGKVPIVSFVGVAAFLILGAEIQIQLKTVSSSVVKETLALIAFVGVGVEGKIGPFKAYAYLAIGFVMIFDLQTGSRKYGGIVRIEAVIGLVIVKVKVRAELVGVVYKEAGKTKCDYSGSVKVQVDILFIFSISASYPLTESQYL